MSVTAVPLHPLTKGTVAKLWIGLLIVVLMGVGLAWLGTRSQQYITAENGMRYRIVEAGEGNPVTPADIAMTELELLGPRGEVLQSTRESGRPAPLMAQNTPTWLAPLVPELRKGGSYQLFVPARDIFEGQPPPPDFPLQPGDTAEIRLRVVDIQREGVAQQQMQQQMQQQAMERMMQEQGGAPGGPGAGAAPGGSLGGPGAGPAPGAPPPPGRR